MHGLPNPSFMHNPALENNFDYCAQKAAGSGSNFYYSFLFLPIHKRRAIMALYAFCREVDDVVDAPSAKDNPLQAHQQLMAWQLFIDHLPEVSDYPNSPITPALAQVAGDFALPAEELKKVIEGMQMDLLPKPFATWEALYDYCDKVAGVVGRLSTRIFGFNPDNEKPILAFATALGLALQLTNITRDIVEDARMDRLYIPLELLAHKGLIDEHHNPDMILAQWQKPNQHPPQAWLAVVSSMCQRAQNAFDEAQRLLKTMPQEYQTQKASRIMGRIYHRVLMRIKENPAQVFIGKTSLSRTQKLLIAAQVLVCKKSMLD